MNGKSVKNWRRVILPAILLMIGLIVGAGLAANAQRYAGTSAEGEAKAGTSAEALAKAAPSAPAARTAQQLYDAAVRDAVFADEDEIMPLVSLDKEDSQVTWNDAGDRVLLLTWNNYPDSYPAGETVTLEWGTVWAFTGWEIMDKYAEEADTVTDWDMRLKQIIGFPPDSEHSTFTGIWVRPEDVRRPAYRTYPSADEMDTKFDEDADEDFKEWFDGNIIWSYFDSAYPWTRLGYTYDWAGNGTEYGLTEFLVNQGAEVEVAFTESTETFLSRLAGGGDSSALYK